MSTAEMEDLLMVVLARVYKFWFYYGGFGSADHPWCISFGFCVEGSELPTTQGLPIIQGV